MIVFKFQLALAGAALWATACGADAAIDSAEPDGAVGDVDGDLGPELHPGEILLDPGRTGPGLGNQASPAVAASAGGYLTAWVERSDAFDGQARVLAARLSSEGERLDEDPLVLCGDCGADDVAVASDGTATSSFGAPRPSRRTASGAR